MFWRGDLYIIFNGYLINLICSVLVLVLAGEEMILHQSAVPLPHLQILTMKVVLLALLHHHIQRMNLKKTSWDSKNLWMLMMTMSNQVCQHKWCLHSFTPCLKMFDFHPSYTYSSPSWTRRLSLWCIRLQRIQVGWWQFWQECQGQIHSPQQSSE